jgi:hypothetical protein
MHSRWKLQYRPDRTQDLEIWNIDWDIIHWHWLGWYSTIFSPYFIYRTYWWEWDIV